MTALNLHRINAIPDGFLDASPEALHTILPGPTLLELPGKLQEPLFISILLHGNEPTGIRAVQQLLKKYANKPLPRSLAIFIGNIAAARENLRRLEDQPDYNRIWPGTELEDCPETRLAREVFRLMQEQKVFASIDIHNNTGLNPHYACINSLDERFLKLANSFGRLIVYFIRPKGVQSAAFAELCPSVTLECGRSDQQLGIAHALDYLESCLHLTEFSPHPLRPQDFDLFHTVAQVRITEQTSFSFDNIRSDLLLSKDVEQMNFTEIPAGTTFGKVNGAGIMPFIVQDESGLDVTGNFFSIEGDALRITRPAMPSMLTLDQQVIRQDCFCYLMERLAWTQTQEKQTSALAAADV